MVTELAIIKIDPSESESFEKMYKEVVSVLREQPGYQHDKLMRAIERPEEYLLAVEWDSVGSHQAFIDSDSYSLMSDPFGKFVKDSSFAHFNTVNSN
jgi:heme-degrading monooxygenase HmoA